MNYRVYMDQLGIEFGEKNTTLEELFNHKVSSDLMKQKKYDRVYNILFNNKHSLKGFIFKTDFLTEKLKPFLTDDEFRKISNFLRQPHTLNLSFNMPLAPKRDTHNIRRQRSNITLEEAARIEKKLFMNYEPGSYLQAMYSGKPISVDPLLEFIGPFRFSMKESNQLSLLLLNKINELFDKEEEDYNKWLRSTQY